MEKAKTVADGKKLRAILNRLNSGRIEPVPAHLKDEFEELGISNCKNLDAAAFHLWQLRPTHNHDAVSEAFIPIYEEELDWNDYRTPVYQYKIGTDMLRIEWFLRDAVIIFLNEKLVYCSLAVGYKDRYPLFHDDAEDLFELIMRHGGQLIVKKTQPAQGLFWVVVDAVADIENGRFRLVTHFESGISHKEAWKYRIQAQRKDMHKLPYDYYPRGRVQLDSRKATIFLNPVLDCRSVVSRVASAFALPDGIKVVRDGSSRHKCFLDNG